MPIEKIRHKGLKELFEKGKTAKISKHHHANCLLILDLLDAISDLGDCQGVKDFHELSGDRKGEFSMHVSGNYCTSPLTARTPRS
ncbi:type II toxin-antitoxin system RelE/ParE family toxin [Inquilinus sp. CAU 1745]|uniref:type II toxin-antitoxin system RelE/ParE family toxin n=1 Tax=Inquilinus sp. CAU 1745 TaxID=3140369 RepID=UPI00325C0ECF